MIAGLTKIVQDANAKSDRIKNELFAPDVSEKLIKQVPNSFLGADTSCVQMFLCKLEPGFWSMQNTTKDYNRLTLRLSLKSNLRRWLEAVYTSLPDLKRLRNLGDRCNDLFPKCQLINSF